MAFLGSRVVFPAIDSVSLGFTGFYWVLLGFTGFYWVFPASTEAYRVLLGFTELPTSRQNREGETVVKEEKVQVNKKNKVKKKVSFDFFSFFFFFFFFGLRFRFAEERNTPALSTKRTSSK